MADTPIDDALAARISETHGHGFITGWIAIVEWCDSEGNFSAMTLNDPTSPPWRLEGLLTARTEFYETEEDN